MQHIKSDIPHKPNYESWTVPHYSPRQFANLTPWEQLQHLCHLGHLAPSTHNTQPWRFLIDPVSFSIIVHLDSQAILPASDVVGRQAMISVGCAMGNILMGGKALGVASTIRYVTPIEKIYIDKGKRKTKDIRYIPLATITFTKRIASQASTTCYAAIFTRKMTRSEFDPQRPIPPHIIHRLKQATDGKITKLHIITDPIRKYAIAEFQAQADSFVINSPAFRKELGEWLLPNATDSYVGMPGIGFGLQDAQAQRLHNGLLNKQRLEPEDGLRFALAGKVGIEKSPMICCITLVKDNPRNWLETGIVMERMFLTAISEGLAVGVHAGIVEVSLVNRMFAVTLGTLRRLSALFRIGYVKDFQVCDRPHSPRLPIDAVILNGKTIGQVSSR